MLFGVAFWQKFGQKFLEILRILAEILRKKLACGASGGKGEAIVEVVRNALEKSSEPCLQLQVGHNTIIGQLLKQSQRHNLDW